MAAAAAALSFAAEPEADLKIAEFSGNASVTWGVDLDTGKTGFKNDDSAKLKVNFTNEGTKKTEGEGIWAELEIKGKSLYAENGAIKDGTASVENAKLHFGPVYLGIRKGDTQVGDFKIPNAVTSSTMGSPKVAGTDHTQGVVLGYSSDLFGIEADFRSLNAGTNYYTNDYGAAAEATLKFVPGLEIKAGADYQFNAKALGVAASEKYTLALGEKFKLIEGVGFAMSKIDTADPTMGLAAGVIFGWGDETDSNAGVPYLDKDPAKKVTPGVGVALYMPLGIANTFSMQVAPSFYSGDLIPNLKIGVLGNISVTTVTVGGTSTTNTGFGVAGGLKYDLKATDSLTISPFAGVRFAKNNTYLMADTFKGPFGDKAAATTVDNGGKNDIQAGNDNMLMNVKVGADVSGLINNTTFSLDWTSRNLMSNNKDNGQVGTINLTCKISM